MEKAILSLKDNNAAGPDNIRITDGVLIKNKELILARLTEYQLNLLNKVHINDIGFQDYLPTQPIIPKLDYPSSFDEV